MTMPIHFDPRASNFDQRDLFVWFFCLASERDRRFRPRINHFVSELVSLFLGQPSSPFASEFEHLSHGGNGLHEIHESLYLFTGGNASFPTTPGHITNSKGQCEIISLLNTTNTTNVRCHDLPFQKCLDLLRRMAPIREYGSLILRLFRQIHTSTREPEKRLESCGSLTLCLVHLGATLVPGKRGARIALHLIRKSRERGMLISKGDLLRVQNLLLLQAKAPRHRSRSCAAKVNLAKPKT